MKVIIKEKPVPESELYFSYQNLIGLVTDFYKRNPEEYEKVNKMIEERNEQKND